MAQLNDPRTKGFDTVKAGHYVCRNTKADYDGSKRQLSGKFPKVVFPNPELELFLTWTLSDVLVHK